MCDVRLFTKRAIKSSLVLALRGLDTRKSATIDFCFYHELQRNDLEAIKVSARSGG